MRNAVCTLICLVLVPICPARTITVDNDAPADFNNIQAAINDANNGDTVEIQPGTYTGPGNRDIEFLGKPITVRSTGPNDPNIVADTIIDCNGTEAEPHRAFLFRSSEDANSILRGVTICNGYGLEEDPWGGRPISVGGAICCKSSNPKIANCVIKDSSAGLGGGIFCNDSSPSLVDCTISGNSASIGGGMYSYTNSCPTLTNCIFINNRASNYGGGGGGMVNAESNPILTNCVFVSNRGGGAGGGMSNRNSSPVLTDCTFKGNSVPVVLLTGGGGGGMHNAGGSPKLTNCIFSGNWAHGGGAMSNISSNPALANCTFVGNRGSGRAICNWWEDCHPRLTNCILWDGGNEIWNILDSTPIITFSNVQGGWPGDGNIDEDPCFADPGYWDPNGTPEDANGFWVDGDYHLKSQAGRYNPNSQAWLMDDLTSPCIDAGDPMAPIGPEPFPNGGIVNMGAHAATPEASKSYFNAPPCETIVAGDVNGDCIVDFRDFRFIALNWMRQEN